MSVRRLRVFLELLALAGTTHALIDEALDVIFLSKEIGEKVLSSWDVIAKPLNATGGVELPIIQRRKESQILARLKQVTLLIERLELNMGETSPMALLLSKMGRDTRLELRLHEMADLLSRVSAANRQMREYVRLQEELEKSTLVDFTQWCVSHDPGALPGLLERVHSLVTPPHHHLLGRGILQLIVDDLKVRI
jgi:hypothetical protein